VSALTDDTKWSHAKRLERRHLHHGTSKKKGSTRGIHNLSGKWGGKGKRESLMEVTKLLFEMRPSIRRGRKVYRSLAFLKIGLWKKKVLMIVITWWSRNDCYNGKTTMNLDKEHEQSIGCEEGPDAVWLNIHLTPKRIHRQRSRRQRV